MWLEHSVGRNHEDIVWNLIGHIVIEDTEEWHPHAHDPLLHVARQVAGHKLVTMLELSNMLIIVHHESCSNLLSSVENLNSLTRGRIVPDMFHPVHVASWISKLSRAHDCKQDNVYNDCTNLSIVT